MALQVDEVKNIMVDNIEKVLERGEKIELLVDKTDNLRFQVCADLLQNSACYHTVNPPESVWLHFGSPSTLHLHYMQGLSYPSQEPAPCSSATCCVAVPDGCHGLNKLGFFTSVLPSTHAKHALHNACAHPKCM